MSAPQAFDAPIYVTRPYLPELSRYQAGLEQIWANRWLTNNGPILQDYNKKLEARLGTPNVCLFNNGTLALQIALQGMRIQGEVITTPFTFVATAHCLYWNSVKPVFVDIDPDTYTLDPAAVKAAITPRTTAVMPVHVYGVPAHVQPMQQLCQQYNLKLIYDAAHAFGVKVGGKDISLFGDCSMFSFHSTKLYHSIEGGMLTFADPAYKRSFDYLKNFGFENETEVVMPGTNAKMNEMQALMGMLMLEDIDEIIAKRKQLVECYNYHLKDLAGIKLGITLPEHQTRHDYSSNYAYYPLEIDETNSALDRDALYEALKGYNVFARRYFYPLLTDFACYNTQQNPHSLENARRIASRIMTLPLYHDLTCDEVQRICGIIKHLLQA